MGSVSLIIVVLIFALLAVCFNFGIKAIADVVGRKRIAIAIGSDAHESKLQKLVFINLKIFGSFSKKLLRLSVVEKGANNIAVLFAMKGKKASEEQVISCLLAAACVAIVLGFVFAGSLVFGISLGLCVVTGTLTFSGSRLAKATNDMREQVPDAIQCMANCSASGFSLMQTFEQAEKECSGPLGKTFALAHRRMKLGSSIDEALEVFDNVKSVPELKFISIAFRVQHVAGGPISEVLDCARDSVLSELELARTLRVQTSQAKMSATIVTIMPFILLAVFSFMSPGFITCFFTSIIGFCVFCVAFTMQATGILMVRKTLAKCEG